jgi:transcriptional regulator with XRE-family HTH domain
LSTPPREAGPGANDDLAEVLRSARERSGKTLGDIAKATGLSVYDMTALEKGNFHRIGWSPRLGPDVRRPQGRDRALEVMSQFAQAVGLDPNEIVERYEAERRRHRLEEAKEHAGDRKPPA